TTHDFFGGRERFDVCGARENALCVFLQRGGILRQLDAVVVQTPEQGRNRHIQHREFVTQHELVFHKYGGQLREPITNAVASGFLSLRVDIAALFQYGHVHKKFLLEIVKEQSCACAHDGIRGHELRMWKALVDVLVDDVRLVQNQVA